jgi:hypothetical protein
MGMRGDGGRAWVAIEGTYQFDEVPPAVHSHMPCTPHIQRPSGSLKPLNFTDLRLLCLMLFSFCWPDVSPPHLPYIFYGVVGLSCLTFGAVIEGHDGMLGDGLVDGLQKLVRQVLALTAAAEKG